MSDLDRTFHDSDAHLASVVEALDASDIGTIVLDDDFSVIWVNKEIEKFLGVSREDLLNRSKPSLVDAELKHRFERPERFAERVHPTYEEGARPAEFECHVLPGDERAERWLLHRSKPIENGQYAGGRIEHYTDITDRKRQASALDDSRKKFQTIFEHANDAIFIVDVEHDAVVDCNPAAEELVGYSAAELRSMPASDLHPHNLSEFKQFANRVFEQGHGWTEDITCYCKSGDIIPAEMSAATVELDGRPHLVNHIRNTAEREEREWFETLIEHSTDLITVLKHDGTIRYQSPSIDHALGYTPEEVRDNLFLQHVHPDDRPEVAEILERVAYGPETVTQRREYRFRRADGSWRWLESIVSHRPDAAISGYVLNSRDITPRKESQQRAAVLHRMLRHNLRNDLNVILGHAEELAAAEDDTVASHAEPIVEKGSDLLTATEHTKLLSDIFDSHRVQQRRHDVADLVKRLVTRFEGTNPEVRFSVDCSTARPVTAAPKLDVAVEHVVRNAVEHNDADEPRVDVSVEPTAPGTEYVDVTVADNGPGIPEQERTVLLEGEETPLQHGSGLGLWIVNWIITRSGGRVAVAERDPRGSRVTLTLPATE